MEIIDLNREADALRDRFIKTQDLTEDICSPLSPEDCLLSVTEDTSPPKWHLGHTSWFFAKFVLEKFSAYEISQEFDFVFNSYYKAIGPHIKKVSRGSVSRPGLGEIREWRKEVRERVSECITGSTVDNFNDLKEVIEIGINHEQQHQELLLMDIKRNFFENPLRPRYKSRVLAPAQEQNIASWINIPSGLVKVGVPLGSPEFHYDNESDSHQRWLDSFMLMSL